MNFNQTIMPKFSFLLLIVVLFCCQNSLAQVSIEKLDGTPTNFNIVFFGEDVEVKSQGLFKRGYRQNDFETYDEKASAYGLGNNSFKFEFLIHHPPSRHLPDSSQRVQAPDYSFIIDYINSSGDTLLRKSLRMSQLEYTRSPDDEYAIVAYWLNELPIILFSEIKTIVFENPPLSNYQKYVLEKMQKKEARQKRRAER